MQNKYGCINDTQAKILFNPRHLVRESFPLPSRRQTRRALVELFAETMVQRLPDKAHTASHPWPVYYTTASR